MTTLLIWRDEWSLGIDDLDRDHRELVRLLNRLVCLDDPGSGGTAESAGSLAAECLEQVIAHLRLHFGREEAFLQSINYPGFLEHKTEHSLEMAELMELKRLLKVRGARRIDEGTAASLKRWFFNHVIAEDQRYADFYFEQLGANRRS